MTESLRSTNRFRCLFSLLVCLLLTVTVHAQSGQPVTQVTLGPSVVPLYGPWKFTVGDSPIDPAVRAMFSSRIVPFLKSRSTAMPMTAAGYVAAIVWPARNPR